MSEPAKPKESGWVPALASVAISVVVLVVFAVILAGALSLLADFRPVAAARDAILDEHMWQQAYRR